MAAPHRLFDEQYTATAELIPRGHVASTIVPQSRVVHVGGDDVAQFQRQKSRAELASLLGASPDAALSRVVQLAQRRIPLARFEAAAEGLSVWAPTLTEMGFVRLAAFVFKGHPSPLNRVEFHRAALVATMFAAVAANPEHRARMVTAAAAATSTVVATAVLDYIDLEEWPDLVSALRASPAARAVESYDG